MCLTIDFCMEKLLAREVTIFPEKNKNCKILLKIYKTNTKLKEKLTRGPNVWIKLQICQNLKSKMFGLSPLPMQNPYSKTFLDIKFLFVTRFSKCFRHILGLKEC